MLTRAIHTEYTCRRGEALGGENRAFDAVNIAVSTASLRGRKGGSPHRAGPADTKEPAMTITASRTARRVLAASLAGGATIAGAGATLALGAGAASAAPTTASLQSATLAQSASLSAVSAQTAVSQYVIIRPPYGCFVCGLGGCPAV